jgi:hypothetical protein
MCFDVTPILKNAHDMDESDFERKMGTSRFYISPLRK